MKSTRIWLLVAGFITVCTANIDMDIQACNSGDIKYCYKAAVTLTTGDNAKNQEKKTLGLEYMRKACKFGHTQACDTMGETYYAQKHYQAAKPYLVDSCNRGKKNACEAIGTMYRDAQEIKQDDVLAKKYYDKACTLGSADACINIAIMYRGGFGVNINRDFEKKYYQKACDFGSNMGCKHFIKMDNQDKGIEEAGILDMLKSLFN